MPCTVSTLHLLDDTFNDNHETTTQMSSSQVIMQCPVPNIGTQARECCFAICSPMTQQKLIMVDSETPTGTSAVSLFDCRIFEVILQLIPAT
jgi:hypothetical protein